MEHKDSAKIITGKMKRIAKALSKHYTVKIGLLASQGGSEQISENLDLAGLGAVQEFGAKIPVTDKLRNFFRWKFGVNLKKTTTEIEIPARSWLYAPIKDPNFRKRIYDFVSDEEILEEYADKDFMKRLANIIGNVGLLQIQKAFANGGINGEWAPNNEITIKGKGSAKPLIADGHLRKSITFEVE